MFFFWSIFTILRNWVNLDIPYTIIHELRRDTMKKSLIVILSDAQLLKHIQKQKEAIENSESNNA